ncbi:hypothetical protein KY311_05005 [Candidatus Woesearchaeota archaeon]|nr:hypothetical protein [Candidatus Woesearchaeota archaeon]
MDLADLRVNIEKTKGAIDFYEELLSSDIKDEEILRQKLLLVKGEILKLTMRTEHIVKALQYKFKR